MLPAARRAPADPGHATGLQGFFSFFASNNIYADTAGHAAKGTVIMTASKIAPQPPAKSEVRQPR